MQRLLCWSLMFCLVACSAVPKREVLPYPDHIRAAVEVGDTVSVVTKKGESVDVEVAGITTDSLEGGDRVIRFDEIKAIYKRSLRPLRNPCDSGQPLGCSIPLAITVLSDYYADYGAEFREPCVSHDFCYAFGQRTYGHDKQACDRAFLQDMQDLCAAEYGLDLVDRADCLLAAEQMHAAVQGFGDKRFRGDNSQYCEYAGPP